MAVSGAAESVKSVKVFDNVRVVRVVREETGT